MNACRACGAENEREARFCSRCGTALPAAAPPVGEERKVVSVLFADLVGFTARSEQADPEDVRALLRTYHAALKEEIERFGGTVEKFVGDAVMAVFGAPVAHEDDAERAVRAALAIAARIDSLNENEPARALAVRAGVNTGEALVVLAARPEEGEGMVAGDVVNTAARLQQSAPAGGIAVGEATYHATSGVIEYDELEPIAVKGKAEAVPVWRARGARSRVRPDRPPATPFVGRDRELALLDAAYARVATAREAKLVTVVGEPGAGKSRLVREFRELVDARPELVSWRQGQCLPYGEGITFWALGEIVKAEAGILESDGAENAAAKLALAVEAAVEDPGERDWLRGSLAPLVGAPTTGTAGAGERGASFTAWRRFLEGVAARRTLVLVFEDLHWADTALVEFIEHLVEWANDGVLVVCTARPELYERHAGWATAARGSTTVSLAPLSDEETTQLIGALTTTALPPATHATLLARAGGNPLFAEEFVRMLRDRPDAGGEAVRVPETLQALIASRLDALTPAQKSLAHDAAVVGEVFWAGALASIAATDELTVEQALHELARKELVRPVRTSSVQGHAEYSFWHILVRDVAYGQIPRLARIAKHRAAAEWIERIAGERVRDHAELLAHHYEEALELARAAHAPAADELRAPAARFLVLAGDRAFPLDLARSEAFYRRALVVLPADDPARATALTKIADAAQEAGRLREAAATYEEALAGFRRSGARVDAGAAMIGLARAVWRLGETVRSRGLIDEAIELLRVERARPELARAYGVRAVAHMVADEGRECLELSERALAMAEDLGLDNLRVRMRQTRGYARLQLGDLAGAQEHLRDALSLGHELGLGFETASSYTNLADFLSLLDPADSLEVADAGIEFSERRGLTHNVMWLRAERLRSLFDLGRWDEVLDAADEVIAWDAAYGGSQIEVMANEAQAKIFVWRGDVARASAVNEQFLPRARAIREPQVLAPGLTIGATIEHARGARGSAVSLIEELADLTENKPVSRANQLSDGLRVCAAAGALDLGERLLHGAAEEAPRHRNSVITGRAALAEARGDLEAAAHLYAEAAERWHGFPHILERGLALLGAARCLHALGRVDDTLAGLREARTLFERLRSEPLVADAERLLSARV